TRASGVFAVADNDEWDDNMPATAEPSPIDDIPGSGEVFTSVLSSPAIAVSGETMFVNYDSSYRQTGPQIAGLDVSFDGGERTRLFEYSTQVLGDQVYLENRRVGVPIEVPAGAETMQLHWAVEDATNDWYWAIDHVEVTTSAEEGTEAPMPPAPPSPADLPDGVSDKKFLYVSLDGVRYDRMMEANTPNLDALAERGQRSPMYLQDSAMASTSTGPTHTNQFTGVWPDKHGVRDNSFNGYQRETYPDFLTRAEQVRPELSTYSILDWAPLNDFLIDSPDVKIQQTGAGGLRGSDERSTETSVVALRDHNPDLAFVYLHEPDGVGHAQTGDSPAYIESIERKDEQVGRLIAAIEDRPTYDQEDWLIVVTTDHGFFEYGHGGNQFTTREAWLIAAGGQVEDLDGAAAREWRPVDVAVSGLSHVGIEIDPAWNLDGIPLWTESTDPFDTLADKLQPAVDEAAKPRDLLGWTKETPEGWEIEENTPDLGVTEYRGWSFMTGPFWVSSDSNQGREGFVRGRDVIAVADPDEWDDIGFPTQAGHRLDSTLWSPWSNVDAGGAVDVSFQHHYRQVQRASDPQTATVIAQWDNGEETVLWRRDQSEGSLAEVSTVLDLDTIAPEGATKVRIGWHMFGANNFYWAIDAPVINAEYTEPAPADPVTVAIETTTKKAGKSGNWQARMTLTAVDTEGAPLAGAEVTLIVPKVHGPEQGTRTLTCTTDANGTCNFGTVVFSGDAVQVVVERVAHADLPDGAVKLAEPVEIAAP
ncbi:MAG: hypothetical protein GXX86_01305, partial [Propionibacterium sp.]|nr:hypothetical protein [Propionibacterium sp.]